MEKWYSENRNLSKEQLDFLISLEKRVDALESKGLPENVKLSLTASAPAIPLAVNLISPPGV